MRRRIVCVMLVCMSMLGCLCVDAGAIEEVTLRYGDCRAEENVIMRASGSFNMSVGAYRKTAADKVLALAAGETVRIRATYDPEDASLDFGLIDPEGIFHYINVTTGSIDETIEVPDSGNYTLAIQNNSGETVRVTGIVKY